MSEWVDGVCTFTVQKAYSPLSPLIISLQFQILDLMKPTWDYYNPDRVIIIFGLLSPILQPHVQCILWLLLPCWHESNRTSHQNDHPWAHFTREGGVCEGFDPTARQVELVVLQPWGHGSSAQQTHKKYKELIKKVCPNSGVVLLSSSCSDCYYMKEGFYMKFTAIVYCVLGDDACSFPLSYWVGSLLAICMPTCVD